MHKKPRVLFVLKLRQTSGGGGYAVLKSSGLLNSATFVNDMLVKNGYDAKLVQVVDNNGIDKEVHKFKPDIVIIEAFWVVPEKFDVLSKLHPNVKWIIRAHSEIPFLANEGSSLGWITDYVTRKNVYVSFNSWQTHLDFKSYLKTIKPSLQSKLVFLPNYYPVTNKVTPAEMCWDKGETIEVGCFGAIRPMKNTLIQAFAAVKFADQRGLKCRFHINAGRVEQKGDSVLKNLRSFFNGLQGKHELVEHGWLERDEFLALVSTMDIGLQVSFSETFNIVSADFVSQDIPIVTSNEIDWMPLLFTADPTNTDSIVRAIRRTLFYDRHFVWMELPRRSLKRYVKLSEKVWLDNLPTVV
jgi:hypothetical protein